MSGTGNLFLDMYVKIPHDVHMYPQLQHTKTEYSIFAER
jgi:hypothetical protein